MEDIRRLRGDMDFSKTKEIWISSSGKNNISRVSAANERNIVFDTRTKIFKTFKKKV
jgi:hypothetical protein